MLDCNGEFAFIRATNAKIIIQPDTVLDISQYDRNKEGFLTPTENNLRKHILGKIGVEPRRFTGTYSKNIKFEEEVLEEGEQVAVVGTGRWLDTINTEELRWLSEQGIKKIFEIISHEDVQTVISDSPDLLDDNKDS